MVELSNQESVTENEDKILKDDAGWKFWRRRRNIIALLIFFAYFIIMVMRVNLSIAIVIMTTSTNGEKPEFDWNLEIRGFLLSSYFYGFISTQFFGGWLCSRIGGKRVLGISLFLAGIVTMATPPLARTNIYLLYIMRVLIGILEGIAYPCPHSIWANWLPPLERTRLTSISLSGFPVGVITTMILSGLIASCFDWPGIFYIYGLITIIWSGFWWYIATDKPEDDPWISSHELNYIKQSLGTNNSREKSSSCPWRSIFTSIPFWTIVAVHFSANWGYHTLSTSLPTFTNDIFHFDVEKNGILLALPFCAEIIGTVLSGYIAEYFTVNDYLTKTQLRKVFICVGFLTQMICIVLAGYQSSRTAVIACITIGIWAEGFCLTSYVVNYLEIAPGHASVLIGIGNTLATLSGIISPSLTGFIVVDKTAEEWRIVFIIMGTIYLIGAVLYGFFGSAEDQKWQQSKELK